MSDMSFVSIEVKYILNTMILHHNFITLP